jgi:hypothetical protein
VTESDLLAMLRFYLVAYRGLIEGLNHLSKTPPGLPGDGQFLKRLL